MVNEVEKEVVAAAEQIAPSAPAVEVLEAAVNTAIDPSPANILADIELAIKLVNEFKANVGNLHPSVLGIIKALF